MVDKVKVAAQLGAPPYGIFYIRDMRLLRWGEDVEFDCIYEPGTPGRSTEQIHFQITLKSCRELRWRVYAHLKHPEDKTLRLAAVANIGLGSDKHRKPASFLTDSFGLTVSYGTMEIEKVEQKN